jgi:flagellar biosynthetic protein FliR
VPAPALAITAGAPADALARLLLAGGLGAARTIPVTWLVPAFGGPPVGAPLRLGLGVVLALLALPRLLAGVDGAGLQQAGALLWLLVVAREIAIGTTVALVASFAFRAAEAAGRLGDVLRGAHLSEVLDPASAGGERSTPMGVLYLLTATVIFLELGGLGRLAVALGRSYDAIPLGLTGTGGSLAHGLRGAAEVIIVASAKLVQSALGLVAPVMVALLLADLALGAIARAAPRLPIYFVGMPARALLGVGVVLVGLGALDAALVDGFADWFQLVDRAVTVWAR